MMRRLALHIIWIGVIFSLAAGPVSQAKIIYVDDDAPPPGDGTSWATAYTYLQDALADANDSEELVEIRVAQGIYKPDQGAYVALGDIYATFHVHSSMVLKGGFTGLGQPDPNTRDVNACKSILSGDLAGDDPPIEHGADLVTGANYLDNSLHVMTVEDLNETALVDGITITGGFDETDYFVPCGGAAICCLDASKLTIRDCTFKLNAEIGNFGGAIFGGTLNLINCTFERNLAGFGGAISDCRGTIRECRFIGNVASWDGGALHDCNAAVQHSSFAGNSAQKGGAVFLKRQGDLALSNCTFVQNIASTGRTLGCSSYGPDHPVTVSLRNCILWNGGDEIRSLAGSTVEIGYSDVQGGQARVYDPCETVVWGPGNTEADPCFVDPGYCDDGETTDDPNDDFFVVGDYHLKSQAGRWDPTSGSWVADEVTSSCIDAGDPNSDIGAEVWPHGGRINMGAYGGTSEASMSAEPVDMFLPRIACIHWYNSTLAESCQSFLQAHGCSVTLIRSERLLEHPLDDYDLIMIDADTQSPAAWPDQAIATVYEAGKPILGLGKGGYRLFGGLGLSIGYPNGASNTLNSIEIVDPNRAFFDTPYPVAIPADGILQMYHDVVDCTVIYLWPAPDTVDPLAHMVNDAGYYPLVAEQGHLLWGFTESPEQMTETARRLFLNGVILTANGLLESEAAATP